MCGFQNSNIDICKNKPQKYATKIPTTKQKGIHTFHQFIVSKPNTAHATKFFSETIVSFIPFLVFTKILRNLCLHFARAIFMGKTEKNGKKITQLK